ncbi:MAG: hypothetical protein JOZ38_09635 [Candidatus Eremiobacteraeota bacterium]|nr:hypothetical protein [Candidatus Eremiobacteraeota bacterium]
MYAKIGGVIRVRVPLDVHAVASSGSGVFTVATPLRLGDVVALAVREAQGTRAPHDKVERSVNHTLAALRAGSFTVDVDGRTFARADDVVVCADYADVRFFLTARGRHGRRAEVLRVEL